LGMIDALARMIGIYLSTNGIEALGIRIRICAVTAARGLDLSPRAFALTPDRRLQ
jgi:hypothetical protein